jgi:hypothetical protein
MKIRVPAGYYLRNTRPHRRNITRSGAPLRTIRIILTLGLSNSGPLSMNVATFIHNVRKSASMIWAYGLQLMGVWSAS